MLPINVEMEDEEIFIIFMSLGSRPVLFLAIISVKISNYSCLAEILEFELEAGGTCDLFGSNEKGMKTQQMNFCHPYLI